MARVARSLEIVARGGFESEARALKRAALRMDTLDLRANENQHRDWQQP
jgi:hypothetical protein